MICLARHIMHYPAQELLVGTYSSGTGLFDFRRREPPLIVILHRWHPDGHPLQEDKKWNRPSLQDRYKAWWPKTARPACPGTATTYIQTCAGKCHKETLIQRTLKKMLHNSRKPKKTCSTVTCIFFNIPNKYFSNQKVCIIEQLKERWCKHLT